MFRVIYLRGRFPICFGLTCMTQEFSELRICTSSSSSKPLLVRWRNSSLCTLLINHAESHDWWRYDHDLHALGLLPGSQELDETRAAANELIDRGQGVLMLFVAEPGMTFTKYEEACSLVWRDAGVLLGYLSIVAEALELNFCPLGITGDIGVRKLSPEGRLFGAGMAVVGARK